MHYFTRFLQLLRFKKYITYEQKLAFNQEHICVNTDDKIFNIVHIHKITVKEIMSLDGILLHHTFLRLKKKD